MSNAWICKRCRAEFIEDNCKVLECEVCHAHKCAKCLKLTSPPQYATASRMDFVWICSDECRAVLKGALMQIKVAPPQLNAQISDIFDSVKNIEGKLNIIPSATSENDVFNLVENAAIDDVIQDGSTLRNAYSAVLRGISNQASGSTLPKRTLDRPTPMKEIIKEAMEEQNKEDEEREKRVNNIIVFKAKGPDSDNRDVRTAADQNFTEELLKEIGAEEVAIEGITRLGKREPSRTRPLRIRVRSVADKTLIMSRLKNLGDAPTHLKSVVVTHDLTPAQRNEKKLLQSEATEKGNENFWFVVRSAPGPRWDPKIVKIKRRPNPSGA